MKSIFKWLYQFISYWYFRYTLVTELYMVEYWEELMIYGALFIFFSLLSLFNNYVVLDLVARYRLDNNSIVLGNSLGSTSNPSGF